MRGFAFTVLLFISIFSETYAQELICTAGDIFAGTSIQIEWSLGETVIDTYDNDPVMLTQGFHQPELIHGDEESNVGIGTTIPRSKVEIQDGDIYMSSIDKGIIMTSPDGQCWRGTINNSGVLDFAPVTCP